MILPPELRGHPPAMTDADARRGGFRRHDNPAARECVVFLPIYRTKNEHDKRAFRKRVAKRRSRKGYR